MKQSPLGLGLGLGVSGLVLSLSMLAGCGGEDDPPAARPAAADEATQLTAEEAAHLEAFRASRAAEAGSAENKPAAEKSAQNKVDPNLAAWDIAAQAVADQKSDEASPSPRPLPDAKPPSTKNAPTAFRKHAIEDQTGMVAATMLVPQGWAVESSVTRQPPNMPGTFAWSDILVSAPDGREFHMYPDFGFVYSNQMNAQPFQPVKGGMFLPPPESIGQWLLQIYQLEPDAAITNLRIVSEEEYTPLTQMLRKLAQPTLQGVQQIQATSMPGDEIGFDTQGVKVIFRYEKHGETKEETFVAGWQIIAYNMQSIGMFTAHWGVYNMRSVSGPIGTDYMNDPALVTISQSFQTTPQWNDAMAKFYRSIAPKPNQPSPPSSAASVGQTNSDVLDIMHKGWSDREAIKDAGQASSVNMIHERTRYADPSAVGGSVDLSSHYQHMMTDGQGNYLGHNDANWNVNADPNWNQREWQTMTPR